MGETQDKCFKEIICSPLTLNSLVAIDLNPFSVSRVTIYFGGPPVVWDSDVCMKHVPVSFMRYT